MVSPSLRVLHVSTWNIPCGIATYCGALVQALQAAGVENDVFDVQHAQWKRRRPGDDARWLDAVAARAAEADVVHVQHEHGLYGLQRGWKFSVQLYGRLLSTLQALRRPVATTFHSEPLVVGGGKKSIFRSLRRWRNRCVWSSCVSRRFGVGAVPVRGLVHTSATLERFLSVGAPRDAFDVFPHPCHPPKKSAWTAEEAKASLGLPASTRLIAAFGFISRYKGFDLALQALETLPPDVRLAVVGGPHPTAADGYFEEFLDRVHRLGLGSRVVVTGFVDEDAAARWFAAADLCVAPYRLGDAPSASGAVTWALTSGKPTIAARIPAFQAIQDERECFFMVSPESPRELGWAVQKLLGDETLRRRLSKNAATYCRERSWDAAAAWLIPFYERMLGRGSEPGSSVLRRRAAVSA